MNAVSGRPSQCFRSGSITRARCSMRSRSSRKFCSAVIGRSLQLWLPERDDAPALRWVSVMPDSTIMGNDYANRCVNLSVAAALVFRDDVAHRAALCARVSYMVGHLLVAIVRDSVSHDCGIEPVCRWCLAAGVRCVPLDYL